ncbi:Translation machinery-associated protein 22 [Metarhizium acridum]|uniref:Translation machinery-associated protein 22 n=1 Tax=Metarhizium acridum TaxID=92637 RepID=UPI001C6AFDD1|nr:Translation machinery-associated protein 22 [Metarhizium acridum]
MADVEQPDVSAEPQARHVTYCGVCTLPPEYCEYGGTVKKCQEWLEKNNKELYDRIWSAEALEAATASLSVEAQKRAAKDAQKKTAKAEAAEAKQADKIANSVVTIKRIERNKKKFVTGGHWTGGVWSGTEKGGQRSRQKVRHWLVSDQDPQWGRRNRGAGRC